MRGAAMAKFKAIIERVETIVKQAQITVHATSAEEARQQILADLEVDEGAYDDDMEPIESGAGACTVTVESTTHDTQSEIPRALAS
jgi:hypothetical protein